MFILKIGAVLILLAVLLYFVSWFSYRPFWTISGVAIVGTAPVSNAAVQAIAIQNLGGAYDMVLSKANEYIYPRGTIERAIKAAFPQVATVVLSITNNILRITLTPRQMAYWWCVAGSYAPIFPDSAAIATTQQCDQMDASGFIFMPTIATSSLRNASTTLPFRFYGTTASSSQIIGTSYMGMSVDDFGKLTELISILGNHGLPSYALIQRPDGVCELFLNQGGMIVFDADQNFNQVASDIIALQASTPIFSSNQPLAYVDVRLGNKAFYKFSTSSSSTTLSRFLPTISPTASSTASLPVIPNLHSSHTAITH